MNNLKVNLSKLEEVQTFLNKDARYLIVKSQIIDHTTEEEDYTAPSVGFITIQTILMLKMYNIISNARDSNENFSLAIIRGLPYFILLTLSSVLFKIIGDRIDASQERKSMGKALKSAYRRQGSLNTLISNIIADNISINTNLELNNSSNSPLRGYFKETKKGHPYNYFIDDSMKDEEREHIRQVLMLDFLKNVNISNLSTLDATYLFGIISDINFAYDYFPTKQPQQQLLPIILERNGTPAKTLKRNPHIKPFIHGRANQIRINSTN